MCTFCPNFGLNDFSAEEAEENKYTFAVSLTAHMKKGIKTTISVAALFAALTVSAGEERTLSLDDALSLTMANNPALRAAACEEKAAEQERRAAIGLRMPQIGVTGAYAYLGKDIGVDLNEMKGPAGDLANKILGSGLVPPELVPSIQGLIAPLMGADWFLKVQDRSLGFVGGQVTVPLFLGGKINAANRATRINSSTARAAGAQTRNALV